MTAPLTRRRFLQAGLAAPAITGSVLAAAQDKPKRPKLDCKIGVTTGSFMRHLSTEVQPGKIRLLDVPALMKDRLGLTVLDLMTRTLASFKPDYLDELRRRSEDAGCIITNLKLNQPGLDMASPDKAVRDRAVTEYCKSIDAAEQLGCRWVRPLPGAKTPDKKLYVESYRRLIDYAKPKGISLLIENFGWMQNDPDALPEILEAVGDGLDACPDTGNWTNAARAEGLKKAFPHAVTCDFKAFQFGPNHKHPRYDLKQCFDIGWTAGFHGPWCFEHFHENLDGLIDGLVWLRGRLEAWMAEKA